MNDRIDWHEVGVFLGGGLYHRLSPRSALISVGHRESQTIGCDVLLLTDNGGEVNVHGLNHRIDLPSIPCTRVAPLPSQEVDGWAYVGPMTIAMRLWAKFNGLEVDYADEID